MARTATRSRRRTSMAPRRRVGPSPALAKTKATLASTRAALSAARRKGREGGALNIGQIATVTAGGALNGVVQSFAGHFNLPFNPTIPVGLGLVGLNYFGVVKGKLGNYCALAGAGMLAAGASDIVENVMDSYVLGMLGMGEDEPFMEAA